MVADLEEGQIVTAEPPLKKMKMISSSSSSMKKRIIYMSFRLRQEGNRFGKWYRVDLSSIEGMENSESELWPAIHMPDKYPDGFKVVGLESKIYAVGGLNQWESPKVAMYDTMKGGDWVCKRDMHLPRYRAQVVAFDGNIYAMGNTGRDPALVVPWGEVYNPKQNSWRRLTPPAAVESSRVRNSTLYLDQQAIIVTTTGGAYIFRPKERALKRQWKPMVLPPQFARNRETDTMVVVRDIIYMFNDRDGSLYAYDLVNGEGAPPHQVKGEDFQKLISAKYEGGIAFLLYIGNGEFCLIWSLDRDGNSRVNCLRFQISSDWIALPLAYKVYNVSTAPGYGYLDSLVQLHH